MLKITAIDSGHQRRLVLEGALVEPWVGELERNWAEAQAAEGVRALVVDLKDVTTISERGKEMLSRMMASGATFQCCRGVLTKHVLRELEQRRKAQTRKG